MGIEFDGSMNIFWYFSVFYLECGVWSVCGWICFVVLYLFFFRTGRCGGVNLVQKSS